MVLLCLPPHCISPSASSRPLESLDSSLHLDRTQKAHLHLDNPHLPPGTCTGWDSHLNRINNLRIMEAKKSHSFAFCKLESQEKW